MKITLRNKGIFFIVQLLLLLFIFAVTTAHAVNFADYFPLDSSVRILTATVADPGDLGKTYENKVLGTEMINGTLTTKVGVFPQALMTGDPDTYDDFYNVTNDGTTIKLYGNQSYTADPPISFPTTLNDGDIIPAISTNRTDRTDGSTSYGRKMSSHLIDIRDITVSGITFPDALVMFSIDPAYPVKTINFGPNTLGFPSSYLPNSNTPLPGSLTHFTIYAKGIGLIANGDILSQTGEFGALIELVCYDSDGDGYGYPGNALCPKGAATDCNDNNPSVNPGATEGPYGNATCSDALDNDCDGLTDADDSDCKGAPPEQHTLAVTRAGTGDGTVSSSDKLINCGTDCTESYSHGKKVTLKATPNKTNSYFEGWSLDCTGTKPTCSLTMDNDKNITATFTTNPTLTLTKSGDGKGNVKSAPKGIDCGVDCATHNSQFKYKAKAKLTAKADQYSTFLGWSGDACIGITKPKCTVSMDATKTVTAQFGLPDISVSPAEYNFGDVKIKTQSEPVTFTITNNGIGDLKITKMEITGTDAKMFKIKGGGKKTIKPGASLDFSVTFKPTTTGEKTATLRITSNDPDEAVMEIPLSGNGSATLWACQDDDEANGIYRVCNYFPLDPGNQWNYTTGNYFISNDTRTCGSGYSGILYGTNTYEYSSYMQNGGYGLLFAGCQYDEGVFEDLGIPLIFIRPQMQIGETVRTSIPPGIINQNGTTFDTTLVGIETITVPAGTFKTLKFEILTNDIGKCSYKTTLWLGKGLGPVKIHRTEPNPANCLGCMFVCDPNNNVDKLNTPAELTSAIIDGTVY